MIFQVISLTETLESMKDTDKYFRAFFFYYSRQQQTHGNNNVLKENYYSQPKHSSSKPFFHNLDHNGPGNVHCHLFIVLFSASTQPRREIKHI